MDFKSPYGVCLAGNETSVNQTTFIVGVVDRKWH